MQTSFVIIDSKSIKNTDTAKEKGFDAGKKVSGIKLHLAVDILGLPQAMHITKADVTDRNGAIEMFITTSDNLTKVQNMLVERTFAWLEKNRRLWKNCERKLSTSKQMTVLALLTLILKRF